MSTLKTDVLKDVAETVTINISDLPAAVALRADLADSASVSKGAALVARAGQVVDSIAALRLLLKTSASTTAFVTGYYTKGDGGGGDYYLDAADVVSADNGGTVIVAADGGRWKLAIMGYTVSIRQFGAKGDSNGTTGNGTDDTAAVQAAVDWVISSPTAYGIHIDTGTFRLTSPININGALAITDDGVEPYDGVVGVRGKGSWLYFDHTGRGISIDGTAGSISGIRLGTFGTFRNQPIPATAWAPNPHDYDIYINNADVYINDLLLLNPTKGVLLTNGGYGRLDVNRLRGQAFVTMLKVEESYDVVKVNNLHVWPFWQDDTNVHAYTMDNLDAIHLERCDNPMFVNVFSIFARSMVRFSETVTGKTNKARFVNADADRGVLGINVDASVVSGITAQFENITVQAETGVAQSKSVYIEGSNSSIDIGNFRSDLSDQNCIRVEGEGNSLIFAGATRINNFNQSAGGFPAVEVFAGNEARFDNRPSLTGGGAGAGYGGAGAIYVDEWRTFTPVVTSTSGTITTVGAVSFSYRRFGAMLDFKADIAITANGTGAGAVRVTLPVPISASYAIGNGREVALSGSALAGQLAPSTEYCDVAKYDNTYPAVDGSRLIINGSYQIA